MTVLTEAKATGQVRAMSSMGKTESHPEGGGSLREWERDQVWN